MGWLLAPGPGSCPVSPWLGLEKFWAQAIKSRVWLLRCSGVCVQRVQRVQRAQGQEEDGRQPRPVGGLVGLLCWGFGGLVIVLLLFFFAFPCCLLFPLCLLSLPPSHQQHTLLFQDGNKAAAWTGNERTDDTQVERRGWLRLGASSTNQHAACTRPPAGMQQMLAAGSPPSAHTEQQRRQASRDTFRCCAAAAACIRLPQTRQTQGMHGLCWLGWPWPCLGIQPLAVGPPELDREMTPLKPSSQDREGDGSACTGASSRDEARRCWAGCSERDRNGYAYPGRECSGAPSVLIELASIWVLEIRRATARR